MTSRVFSFPLNPQKLGLPDHLFLLHLFASASHPQNGLSVGSLDHRGFLPPPAPSSTHSLVLRQRRRRAILRSSEDEEEAQIPRQKQMSGHHRQRRISQEENGVQLGGGGDPPPFVDRFQQFLALKLGAKRQLRRRTKLRRELEEGRDDRGGIKGVGRVIGEHGKEE